MLWGWFSMIDLLFISCVSILPGIIGTMIGLMHNFYRFTLISFGSVGVGLIVFCICAIIYAHDISDYKDIACHDLGFDKHSYFSGNSVCIKQINNTAIYLNVNFDCTDTSCNLVVYIPVGES